MLAFKYRTVNLVLKSEFFTAMKHEDSSPELLGCNVTKRYVRIPTFRRAKQPANSGWCWRKQIS